MIAVLLISLATTAWAMPEDTPAERPTDLPVIRYTVSAYLLGGKLLGRSNDSTYDSLTSSFGVGRKAGDFMEYYILWTYPYKGMPRPAFAERELKLLAGKLQRVYFHDAEFLFYTSAAEYYEIEARGCSMEDLARYQSLIGVSHDLDEKIWDEVLKPMGKLTVAARKSAEPVPYPRASTEQ
jgi:hypothetical protein